MTEAGRKKLFDLRRDYTVPTDGRFRNYSECSTKMFKIMVNYLVK